MTVVRVIIGAVIWVEAVVYRLVGWLVGWLVAWPWSSRTSILRRVVGKLV
jgi:hypothetical protein